MMFFHGFPCFKCCTNTRISAWESNSPSPFPHTPVGLAKGLFSRASRQANATSSAMVDMGHKWDNKAQQTIFETVNLGHCFPRCHTGFGLCMCLLVLRCPIPRMTSQGNSGMTSLENPTYQMVQVSWAVGHACHFLQHAS